MKKMDGCLVTLVLTGGLGILLVLFAEGTWHSIGTVILMPMSMLLFLFTYGFIFCKVVTLCGGDYKEGWVGVAIFLSFAFWLYLAITYLTHHRR
jgi:hypothetical protein